MIKESILSSINPTIPIILASGSESRKVMLEDAGIKFDVITSHVDEDILKQEISSQSFEKQVIALASAKALAQALPSPLPAPVTKAFLYFKLYFFKYILD